MAAFFLRLDIFLSKAKTYKFIKILVLNLKNKFCFENSPANAISQEELDRPKKKMFDISNRNPNSDKKEIYLKKAESLCLDSKFTLAIDILKSYLQDNPRDAEAIFNLGKNYYLQGKNDPAIKKEYFQQAIRMFNESLLYIDPDSLLLKAENYSYLARLYFDQGENNLARETIDKALKIFPHNQFYRQFIRYLSEASLSQKQKEMFRKLFYYNLGKIINLCRIYNTRIILLNYPSEFQGSSVREAIASVYQVPFIDIGSEFEKAQSSNEKNLLSSDRNHPNAQGYRVMAEIILQRLVSKIGVF